MSLLYQNLFLESAHMELHGRELSNSHLLSVPGISAGQKSSCPDTSLGCADPRYNAGNHHICVSTANAVLPYRTVRKRQNGQAGSLYPRVGEICRASSCHGHCPSLAGTPFLCLSLAPGWVSRQLLLRPVGPVKVAPYLAMSAPPKWADF